MLLCPYCSFSNPETADLCLGCGNDLPPDPGFGASFAEMIQPKEPLDLQTQEMPKNINRTQEIEKIGAMSPNATGSFSTSDDQDVLGDMDAALNTLLRADLGVSVHEDEKKSAKKTSRAEEDDQNGPTRMVPAPKSHERKNKETSSFRSERNLQPPASYVPPPTSVTPLRAGGDRSKVEPTAISPVDPDAWSEIVKKARAMKQSSTSSTSPSINESQKASLSMRDVRNQKRSIGQGASEPPERGLSRPPMSSKTGRFEGSQMKPVAGAGLPSRKLHRPEATEQLNLNDLKEMIVEDEESTTPPEKLTQKTAQELHRPPATDRMESSNWADLALVRLSSTNPAPKKEPTTVEKFAELEMDNLIEEDDDEDEMTVADGARLAQIRDNLFGSWKDKKEPNPPEHNSLESKNESLPTPRTLRRPSYKKEEFSYNESQDHTDPLDEHTLALSNIDASVLLAEAEEDWKEEKGLNPEQIASLNRPDARSSEEHTLGASSKQEEEATGRWFGIKPEEAIKPEAYNEHSTTVFGGVSPVSPADLLPSEPLSSEPLSSEPLSSEPLSSEPLPDLSTRRTRVPFEEQPSTTFLFVALDVEARGEKVLTKSNRLVILEELTQTLTEHIRQSALFIEETEEDRIIARSEGSRHDVANAILIARQLLEEANRFDPSVVGRIRIRCVLSTVTTELDQPRERAFSAAGRLLRGMPVDRIWLDWTSYCSLGKTQRCQEVILPSLEEPAYEVEDLEGPASLPSDSSSEENEIVPPWIGRQNELDLFFHQWNAVKAGEGRQVLLLGSSGSGRSRLVQTFCQQVSHEAYFFFGSSRSCPSEMNTSPYLAGLLQSHLDHHHIDRHQGLKQQIASFPSVDIDGYKPGEKTPQLLFELTAEGPSADADATEEALAWYIRSLASQRPVVIIFDDLFLIERRSSRLLESFIQNPSPHCLLVFVSSEGEYEEVLFSSLSRAHQIELPAFSQEESRKLLDSLYLSNDVTRKQIDQMVSEAQGNPNLLIALAEASKKSKKREITWSYELSIPDAVERLMLQKQQNLSHLEKDTLRKAAVIGDRFWKGAIECLERLELSDGSWGLREGLVISHVDDRSDPLRQLLEKELIQEVPYSNLPRESEYRFPHRLLRRILMRQIPISIRQKMHKHVAQWLSLRDDAHLMTFEIARHLKLAGDAEGAAWRLFESAMAVLAEERFNHALSLSSEALEVLGERNPSLRLKLLLASANAYFAVGDIGAAMQLYDSTLQLSWRLTSASWGAKAFVGLSRCLAFRAEFKRAQSLLLDAKTLAKQANEPLTELEANIQVVRTYLLQGELGEAEEVLSQIRQALGQTKEEHPLVWARFSSTEGWFYRLKGQWRESIKALQDAAATRRKSGSLATYAESLVEQAEFYMTAGDEDSAVALLEEASGILRQKESFLQLQKALLLSASISLARRDTQKALGNLKEAWKQCQMSGEAISIAPIAAALSATHILLRQPQEALHFSAIAIKRLKEGASIVRATTYFFLGEAAASMSPQQIEEMFDPAPPRLPEGGISTFLFLKSVELFKRGKEAARQIGALLSLGRSLLIGGFTQTAINVLERGIADAERVGLGLLLERLQNQRRLLSHNDVGLLPEVSAIESTHSTLIVRKSGPKQGKKPFASDTQSRPSLVRTDPVASPFSSQDGVHPQNPYFQGQAGAPIRPNPYHANHAGKKDK